MKHIATAALMLGIGAATIHAQGVSQITLSCTTPPPQSQTANGCRSSEAGPPPNGTPPIIIGSKLLFVGGFWVWCQSPNGGTPYGPDCSGSIYLEEINLVTGAGVYQTTSVSGTSSAAGPTGVQVSFTSSDGDMACVLNVPASPAKGGTNTDIATAFPSRSITSWCSDSDSGQNLQTVRVSIPTADEGEHMDPEANMKRISIGTGALFVVAAAAAVVGALGAVMVTPRISVRAQSAPEPFTINLQIDGFQPNSSSPFEVKGDFIGTGVWQRLIGPILGTPFTVIPSATGFGGNTCQAEYSQDQIVTSDGSTLIANVTGTRCVSSGSPTAHTTVGIYSPIGGTGRFQGITNGAGPITIDARADGSTSLFIAGAQTGGGGHLPR